jgi:hypothetical protein
MESVSNHQGRMAWGVWPQWVLASAIGFTIGSLLDFGFLSGIAVTVGVVQWLVLRRYLPSASRWILATFVGTLVGIFLGWALGMYGLNILGWLAVGISVCIAQ